MNEWSRIVVHTARGMRWAFEEARLTMSNHMVSVRTPEGDRHHFWSPDSVTVRPHKMHVLVEGEEVEDE